MNSKYNILFILFYIFFLTSCDEEVQKNRSRKGLGENIPIGEYGVVISKDKTPIIGEGFELNYSMKVTLPNTNSEPFTQLITNHDYEFIKKGDTLYNASSRSWWLKNYGKEKKEGLKEMIIYSFLTVITFILAAIIATKWDDIYYSVSDTFLVRKYESLNEHFNYYVNGNYGTFTNILIPLLGVLLIFLTLAFLFYEISGGKVLYLYTFKSGCIIVGVGLILLTILNGFNNLIKNIRVLSIGAIIICVFILIFKFVFGLKLKEMIQHLFEQSL